jgi:transcriptional regulator NrdR family protein
MSMRCLCGSKSLCTDSRPYPNSPQDIRRRYKCLKCGDRWTTVESVAFIDSETGDDHRPSAKRKLMTDHFASLNSEFMRDIRLLMRKYSKKRK